MNPSRFSVTSNIYIGRGAIIVTILQYSMKLQVRLKASAKKISFDTLQIISCLIKRGFRISEFVIFHEKNIILKNAWFHFISGSFNISKSSSKYLLKIKKSLFIIGFS
jgi:hypothetical protein